METVRSLYGEVFRDWFLVLLEHNTAEGRVVSSAPAGLRCGFSGAVRWKSRAHRLKTSWSAPTVAVAQVVVASMHELGRCGSGPVRGWKACDVCRENARGAAWRFRGGACAVRADERRPALVAGLSGLFAWCRTYTGRCSVKVTSIRWFACRFLTIAPAHYCPPAK